MAKVSLRERSVREIGFDKNHYGPESEIPGTCVTELIGSYTNELEAAVTLRQTLKIEFIVTSETLVHRTAHKHAQTVIDFPTFKFRQILQDPQVSTVGVEQGKHPQYKVHALRTRMPMCVTMCVFGILLQKVGSFLID